MTTFKINDPPPTVDDITGQFYPLAFQYVIYALLTVSVSVKIEAMAIQACSSWFYEYAKCCTYLI